MTERKSANTSDAEGDRSKPVVPFKETIVEVATSDPSKGTDNLQDVVDEFEDDSEEEDEDSSPEWNWGQPRAPLKSSVGGQKPKPGEKPKEDKSKNSSKGEKGGKSSSSSSSSSKNSEKRSTRT